MNEDQFRSELYRIILDDKNYVEFFSEHVATYIYESLRHKNEITRQELLKMEIPSSVETTKLLVDDLVKDRANVKRLGERIEE